MYSPDISNDADVIDSRDIISRIEEIEGAAETCIESDETCTDIYDCSRHNKDVADELASLKKLAEQGENITDWNYGATLVRDSYWVDYTKSLVEDCYDVPEFDSWPFNNMSMDWKGAASDLQVDYMDIDYDGVTYWVN